MPHCPPAGFDPLDTIWVEFLGGTPNGTVTTEVKLVSTRLDGPLVDDLFPWMDGEEFGLNSTYPVHPGGGGSFTWFVPSDLPLG